MKGYAVAAWVSVSSTPQRRGEDSPQLCVSERSSSAPVAHHGNKDSSRSHCLSAAQHQAREHGFDEQRGGR